MGNIFAGGAWYKQSHVSRRSAYPKNTTFTFLPIGT